ncbi:MAG TPA: hypothetical protein VHX86_13870 [Tepidisphaeraceae bacterium]|jgi:hypothetical protein|nr:hypothetical protein [Tepidisphaeraceae bacterium]
MQAALYYPFTGPKSELFLKTSMFLWDKLDFIVPWTDFRPYTDIPDGNEALEIIGQSYVPTEDDKRRLHDELMDVCTRPIPPYFNFPLENPDSAYDFYPRKLLDETWQMLEESQLAKTIMHEGRVAHASTAPLFGYYMMSLLAVCCSGNRKRLITDEVDPYHALANLLGDADSKAPSAEADSWHGRLIAMTLSGPDFSKVSLANLVSLRKSEDTLLKDLRRSFLDRLDSTVSGIRENADNPNTIRDFIHEYTQAMEDDLLELKRALRMSAGSLLLSKEFGVAVIAFASSFVEPVSGGIVTAGGLTKGLVDYRGRRQKILREHPSAWLLASLGGRLPIF